MIPSPNKTNTLQYKNKKSHTRKQQNKQQVHWKRSPPHQGKATKQQRNTNQFKHRLPNPRKLKGPPHQTSQFAPANRWVEPGALQSLSPSSHLQTRMLIRDLGKKGTLFQVAVHEAQRDTHLLKPVSQWYWYNNNGILFGSLMLG